MGNAITHFVGTYSRPQKRKLEQIEDENDSSFSNDESQDSFSEVESPSSPKSSKRKIKTNQSVDDIYTPKRKSIKSTAKYIYETLFINGEHSDITIRALDCDWQLHRLYLKQSPYFNGMLSGRWKESSQDVINVDVPDDNIDVKALRTAFGCLYKDDVVLKPVEVIGVLAAATWLQLDGLVAQCDAFMKETISTDTVITYHEASQMYFLPSTTSLCLDWLLHNIMSLSHRTVLRDISESLMPTLVSSADLWVLQVEMDLYTLLKKWIFVRNNPSWDGNRSDLLLNTDTYFKEQTGEQYYLEQEECQKYIKSFDCLRWQHVINDLASLRLIEADRIIPKSWLDPMYRFQWQHMLSVEQGLDNGPKDEVPDHVYLSMSRRCGRILPRDQQYCWRWVGYSYGIDSLISYKNINGTRTISLLRNTLSSYSSLGSVSLQPSRYSLTRLTASSIDEKGNVTATCSSGIKRINMHVDESVVLLKLDSSLKFPLYVTVNCLLTTPSPSLQVPRLYVKLTNETASQTYRWRPIEPSNPQNISHDGNTSNNSVVSEECTEDCGSNCEHGKTLSPQAQSLLSYLRSKSAITSPSKGVDGSA